ncbi:MAG: sugar phosphate isomerase/epimerase family protein [Spirochaetia bacterium]
MYLTGFADEAGNSIDVQIKATKELGWSNIESRKVGDKNIHDIDDKTFDMVAGKLDDAGVRINCFGSAIANWGKQITDPFDSSLEEAKRAIPRMKRLNTRLIRIMSFAVLKDRGPEDQMEKERFRRLNILTSMFLDEGIQPVHENCMNYGGMGWKYSLRLIENVEGLKLVFDTGNPVFSEDKTKPAPYPRQSAWEFYSHVKDHIAYVHIKDGYVTDDPENPGKEKTVFTFPGEGNGDVEKIVADLLKNGYDGGISIEPHMAAVHHDESVKADDDIKYDNYVEYGRRMAEIIERVK